MHWLANLRLRTKLLSAFSLVLMLTLFLGVFANSQLGQVHDRTQELAENWLPSVVAVSSINNLSSDIQRLTLRHIMAATPESKRALEQEVQKSLDAFRQADRAYLPLQTTEEEKSMWALVKQNWADYLRVQSEVMSASQAGNAQQATDLVNGPLAAAFSKVSGALDDLIALNVRGGKESADRSAATYSGAISALWVNIAVVFAVGFGVAFKLASMMAKPMDDLVVVLKAVASGDLTQVIHTQRRDEIGDIQRALGQMVSSLGETVNAVRLGADSVATASSEIAQGNTDLSGRTEAQASSLEETAAAVEQMAGTVKTNADNARQANQLASAASDVAARGGEVVGQVVATMNDIQSSSQKISDIIGVIDGIAFQTNILALNAAVEAARAGEQGRGFAVVAGEVRSLAQRSAQAAREIKTLINDSVEKVNAGSALVSTAGATMQDVVTQVRKVTDLVGEIAHASAEQSQGIGQINQAVAQLDESTQQNAALVEQSMAAAESLRSQAVKLADTVTVFKTKSSVGAYGKANEAISRAQHSPTKMKKPVSPSVAPVAVTASAAPAAVNQASSGDQGDWETF